MIYPAHAGINRTKVLNISQILHLPRTRGDKPVLTMADEMKESTPHTRG